MFQIFERYYDNVSFEHFCRDLREKTHVILLLTSNNEIGGFSTLTQYDLEYAGKKHHILYSGDTIIAKEFRGTAALTMEFLRNIMKAKLKRPFTPVWWFLISKGYKTYLLLANNFINYYPRFDRKTPKLEQGLIDTLGKRYFSPHYNQECGLIQFPEGQHEKLKSLVAPITPAVKKRSPKIAFFAEKNPNWESGEELVCIGEVSLLLGIRHPLKIAFKLIRKVFLGSLRPAVSKN
jgi:hypothetical protein